MLVLFFTTVLHWPATSSPWIYTHFPFYHLHLPGIGTLCSVSVVRTATGPPQSKATFYLCPAGAFYCFSVLKALLSCVECLCDFYRGPLSPTFPHWIFFSVSGRLALSQCVSGLNVIQKCKYSQTIKTAVIVLMYCIAWKFL